VRTVFVREADDVAAASPMLRIDDFSLAQTLVDRSQVADSLALGAGRVRAGSRAGESEVLESEAGGAAASTEETRRQIQALDVRAAAAGVVTTPRPEQLIGQVVTLGDTLLTLGDLSRLDARLRVSGPGAAYVRPGQVVRLISSANQGRAIHGVVDAISTAAGDAGVIEARVSLDAASDLRVGATGDARVVWRRATVLTAIARAVRGWFRSDLLL
jgi:multidrug resistance efflux pump